MTQGVWLPLALATLVRVVMQLSSAFVPKEQTFEIPKVSEVLEWFHLPVMAEAMECDEKEQEAIRLFNSVRNLAEKQRGKSSNG